MILDRAEYLSLDLTLSHLVRSSFLKSPPFKKCMTNLCDNALAVTLDDIYSFYLSCFLNVNFYQIFQNKIWHTILLFFLIFVVAMNTHASIFIQSGTDHHDLSHHDHHKKSSGATITSVLRKQGGTACTGKAYQVRIIAGVIIISKVHL